MSEHPKTASPRRVVSFASSGQLELTTRAGTDHSRSELTTRAKSQVQR